MPAKKRVRAAEKKAKKAPKHPIDKPPAEVRDESEQILISSNDLMSDIDNSQRPSSGHVDEAP